MLRDLGASSLTKEIAARAGPMTAVIEDGLRSLTSICKRRITAGVWTLLDHVLVVTVAAQSDADLGTGVADYLLANNLGPHRGVQEVAKFL